MPAWLAALLAVAAAYAAFVLALVALGRGGQARAWLLVVPDCVVLGRRLMADPRVPRSSKLALALLVGYLVLPLDVVPDFIPVAGQLDDAILAALVLRAVSRAAGPDVVRELWPGRSTGAPPWLR